MGARQPVKTLSGGVVPAIVVEGVLDRGRAEQAEDLLLVHSGLQLFDRAFFQQVALVDGLTVDNAAAGSGRGNSEDEQKCTQ